jgi:SAM-dependent methyltransferase
MRWLPVVVGVAATAGAVAWAARSSEMRQARESMSPGAAPGRLGSWLNSRMDGPSYRAMAQAADVHPDDDLLDIACGWGEFLVTYAASARRVAGVELASAKVALARERLADRIADGTAEVVVADAARLPWPDSSFTAVTCMDAFPFFPDPQAVLAEMYRGLAPGGRAVMSFAAEQLPDGVESRQSRGLAGTYTAISEATATRMVHDAGFAPVRITWTSVAGNHRLIGSALRLLGGDQMDVVVGHKANGAPAAQSA